nr:hypothetical protein [Rhodococcus qingshengii]
MGEHSRPDEATQSLYPWRAVARTVVAFLIAILPAVLAALTDASTATQNTALASAVPIIAGVTKILANPAVDALLKSYLPALATAPKQG